MAMSRQCFVQRTAWRPFYRTEACHVHGWIDCNFRLFMKKERLCKFALVVSSDDWSTATWLVLGACEDGGNRDDLWQHACTRCSAWPVRDMPTHGESAEQSGRGTTGRLGKANRAFAMTSYS